MNESRPIQEEERLAYVDNTLDGERCKDIDAYLVAHPPVAARVDMYLAHRKTLRDAYAPVLREPIPLSQTSPCWAWPVPLGVIRGKSLE
ncbi:hypothetical protein CYJ10_27270 [Cupriavidus pauculus]|uniref:Uncharacterized protein n=1 Tax=Cupriavidus pauculus TaxID=82633 RepID=A0A2N5C5M2_9BURK|nr:hypothetical protein CYJ10_27270 [Cupriavidus pauculus]